MKKNHLFLIMLTITFCQFSYSNEKLIQIQKPSIITNFNSIVSLEDSIKPMAMMAGTRSFTDFRFMFLGMGVTGAICIPLGAGFVAWGVVLNNDGYYDAFLLAMAGGLTFLICGVPLCIVGFILFGVASKKLKQASLNKIELAVAFDQKNSSLFIKFNL